MCDGSSRGNQNLTNCVKAFGRCQYRSKRAACQLRLKSIAILNLRNNFELINHPLDCHSQGRGAVAQGIGGIAEQGTIRRTDRAQREVFNFIANRQSQSPSIPLAPVARRFGDPLFPAAETVIDQSSCGQGL